jgi:hypothetical protein
MRVSLFIALAAMLRLNALALAQTAPVAVALTSTAAPAGGTYSNFFVSSSNFITEPSLNESGQVGFAATLTGGSSTSGVFVGAPGAIQAVALTGSAAPAGGTYSDFLTQVLNGTGQMAYLASLTGGSTPSGLFVGAPGAIQAAALPGTAAPAGGNYSGFYNERLALNESGQVAFRATLTGGASTDGLFVGAAGAVQAAALQGTAAPAGGNYAGSTNGFSNPSVNASGQVAFFASLTGGSSLSGIFVGAPGAIQAAALNGAPAPAGGNYGGLSVPVLNRFGQVAFIGGLTGGSSSSGVFVGAPGAIQAVALAGTAAPGGGTYFAFRDPALNGSGQVAYSATLNGGGSSGVFVGAPGSVQAVALTGSAAPGGVTFGGFTNVSLNGSGRVAFYASLTGAGVTAANDAGVYAGSVGAFVKVVREGDQVDVDPSHPGVDLRTVADNGINFNVSLGGQDGHGFSFSDSGFLVYRLTFTDGSSGIFVSQIPVAEPGGVLAVAGLLLGLGCTPVQRLLPKVCHSPRGSRHVAAVGHLPNAPSPGE